MGFNSAFKGSISVFTTARHSSLLSQINPVHVFLPYAFKIHFNIIIISTPSSSKWCFFPSRYPTKRLLAIYRYLPYVTCPLSLTLLDLTMPIIFGDKFSPRISPYTNFLHLLDGPQTLGFNRFEPFLLHTVHRINRWRVWERRGGCIGSWWVTGGKETTGET